MSQREARGLLSIGAFLIIIVISIILYFPLYIISYWMIFPLIIALSGVWLVALAGIRASNPVKYERGPFSTFSLGLCLLAIGGAWFLYSYGPLYSVILILLVAAALAIGAALKRR
jgi:hypothetical protein